LALGVLGVSIYTGARASLVASVDKDMRERATRQANRIALFLKEQPAERTIRIIGVAKGSQPQLIVPGMPPVNTFDAGKGEFLVSQTPPPAPTNDPARPQFRSRNLATETGKTREGDGPY